MRIYRNRLFYEELKKYQNALTVNRIRLNRHIADFLLAVSVYVACPYQTDSTIKNLSRKLN